MGSLIPVSTLGSYCRYNHRQGNTRGLYDFPSAGVIIPLCYPRDYPLSLALLCFILLI